jgi:hypothetical protein
MVGRNISSLYAKLTIEQLSKQLPTGRFDEAALTALHPAVMERMAYRGPGRAKRARAIIGALAEEFLVRRAVIMASRTALKILYGVGSIISDGLCLFTEPADKVPLSGLNKLIF